MIFSGDIICVVGLLSLIEKSMFFVVDGVFPSDFYIRNVIS